MQGGTMDYDFVSGDTNSVLTVTCKRSDTAAALDLTGATATLKYRIDGGTLVTKTMTVALPETGGICTYTFGTAELTGGIMVAEVEVTAAGKVLSSLEAMRFTVRPKV
jgi:hypothetical protein